MTSKLVRSFAAATALMATGIAGADEYNLQPPQTIIAREIYDLHTLIMWIILVIFVVVFGAMSYSIIKHRKSVGHKAEQFHENTTVEIDLDHHPVRDPDRHGLSRDQDRDRHERHFQPRT